jgi:hypothetical protein
MQRPMAWFLSAILMIMPMMPVQAAMVGTGEIVNPAQSSLAQDKLQQFLDQKAAQQQLQAWGVHPDLVKERIDSLTDSELARINQEIDNLNAGGTSILSVLLIIFIVFIITDVIGATNIFPFIHPVK